MRPGRGEAPLRSWQASLPSCRRRAPGCPLRVAAQAAGQSPPWPPARGPASRGRRAAYHATSASLARGRSRVVEQRAKGTVGRHAKRSGAAQGESSRAAAAMASIQRCAAGTSPVQRRKPWIVRRNRAGARDAGGLQPPRVVDAVVAQHIGFGNRDDGRRQARGLAAASGESSGASGAASATIRVPIPSHLGGAQVVAGSELAVRRARAGRVERRIEAAAAHRVARLRCGRGAA